MTKSDPLRKEETGENSRVEIVPYNDQWPFFFEKERVFLLNILGKYTALNIYHIGSTAVPGLAAKPTIDILVETPEGLNLRQFIVEKMEKEEYSFVITSPLPFYLMFIKGYDSSGPSFNIHFSFKGYFFWDTLYFKEYLIQHPAVAKQYEKLKKELSIKYSNNRKEYQREKLAFISEMTNLAKKNLIL